MTKRMVEALMSMPVDPKSGMGFSVATEFDRVDRVFKTLRLVPTPTCANGRSSASGRSIRPSS